MAITQMLDDSDKPMQVVGWSSTVVNLDGTSVTSGDAYTLKTAVRLAAGTSDVYILIGTAPIATTTNATLLHAGETEYVKIPSGDKISVVGGTVNITTAK